MARRPRILLIADIAGWIFHRHCAALTRLLGDEFDFVTVFLGQDYDEHGYDLVYPLEWNLVPAERIRRPERYVTGIRGHTSWAAFDFGFLIAYLRAHFRAVHVVSRRLYDIFSPALPEVAYVTHGVDTGLFTPTTRTDRSGRRLRLGWAGNRQARKNNFPTLVQPLANLQGVELALCGLRDGLLPMEAMPGFYDGLDAYVCASSSEGNSNALLEAAAMARAMVTTDVGTVPEYLVHGESALIAPGALADLSAAVAALRDDPALRARLGENARKAVVEGWDWRLRAEEYRRWFREALAG